VPFLRFSKDRRGYENTYLLHSSRRRNDKDRPTLLYWFRTPPHVKVGRAAFDETAIRALEDQHPGVEFDWPRILATRPPVEAPEPEQPRRVSPRRASPSVTPTPPPVVSALPEEIERVEPVEEPAGSDVQTPQSTAPPVAAEPSSDIVESPPEPARKFVRVFDRVADPEPERPHHLSDPSAVERMLGSEQLGRLRGQYAAALARIGRRITDATLAESLRALAERINPDAWVTEDDVRQGLQGAPAVQEELARHVGRRQRRRRRSRPAGAQPGQSAQEHAADGSSAADSEAETSDEEEDDGEVE
jgi:hypothetical protein